MFAESALRGVAGCVLGLSGTGCLSLHEAKLSLYAFKYAQSTISENRVFRGGSKFRRVPISFLFYLIELGDRRILVDTGCNSIRGFKMEHFITPVALLERYGISGESISDVIITHAHHDHIGCVSYFRGAVVHIQKDEASAGAKYLKGLQVETFDEGCRIAECVEVKKIAGHSIGSSIAIIHYQGRRIVLAGDECYVRACLDRRIPTGASRNPKKSEEFIRTYSGVEY
jgi:glyoxylase-like metal-dependent hydrolase (beta-lactamase superfamily II)